MQPVDKPYGLASLDKMYAAKLKDRMARDGSRDPHAKLVKWVEPSEDYIRTQLWAKSRKCHYMSSNAIWKIDTSNKSKNYLMGIDIEVAETDVAGAIGLKATILDYKVDIKPGKHAKAERKK